MTDRPFSLARLRQAWQIVAGRPATPPPPAAVAAAVVSAADPPAPPPAPIASPATAGAPPGQRVFFVWVRQPRSPMNPIGAAPQIWHEPFVGCDKSRLVSFRINPWDQQAKPEFATMLQIDAIEPRPALHDLADDFPCPPQED